MFYVGTNIGPAGTLTVNNNPGGTIKATDTNTSAFTNGLNFKAITTGTVNITNGSATSSNATISSADG